MEESREEMDESEMTMMKNEMEETENRRSDYSR
jgi:hypothetical protein